MRYFPLFMIFLCLLAHPAFGDEDTVVLSGYGLFQSRMRAQMKARELEDEYAPPGREYARQDRIDILTRLMRDQPEALDRDQRMPREEESGIRRVLGKDAGRHIGRYDLSMDNGPGGHRRRPSGSDFTKLIRDQMRAWEIEDEYGPGDITYDRKYGPGDFTYDRNDRYNYLVREVNRYLRKMHEREPFRSEDEHREWRRHLGEIGGRVLHRLDDQTGDMDDYRRERRNRLMRKGYRLPYGRPEPHYADY